MSIRVLLVTFAGVIDLMDMVLEWAMTAFGATVGGAAAGCAAGAAVAGKVGCTVGSVLGGIIGVLAQGTGSGEAIGFMLGYILDVCMTFSFGVMLVVFLVLSGNIKWGQTGLVFIGKLIPVLGLFPGWAVYAWRCTGSSPIVARKALGNSSAIRRAVLPSRAPQPNEATA